MWELFLLLIISVCVLATSAIGIKCMNDNEKYGNENSSSKNFLIVTVVSGVIGILLALGGMAMELRY